MPEPLDHLPNNLGFAFSMKSYTYLIMVNTINEFPSIELLLSSAMLQAYRYRNEEILASSRFEVNLEMHFTSFNRDNIAQQ